MDTLNASSHADDRTAHYHLIAAAIEFLHTHALAQPSLEQLALHLGLSPFHLQRVFSDWAGISPKRFLQYLTKEHAHALLRSQDDVLTTSIKAGLSGPGRLHDLMVSCSAMTPGEIRAGGAGLTISAGFAPSRLGKMLAATTPRGVCHLQFTDDQASAWDSLRQRWPGAKLHRDDAEALELVGRVIDGVTDGMTREPAPLHVLLNGTNFQIQVWQALLSIPEGTTTTYARLATDIGRPSSQRAVGGAIAANALAVLIPCHRVIRSDGDLSGYRWGRTRKAALLALESARARPCAAA